MKKYFIRFRNKLVCFRNCLEALCFDVHEYDQAAFEKIVQNFYPGAAGPVRLAVYSIGKGRKNICFSVEHKGKPVYFTPMNNSCLQPLQGENVEYIDLYLYRKVTVSDHDENKRYIVKFKDPGHALHIEVLFGKVMKTEKINPDIRDIEG